MLLEVSTSQYAGTVHATPWVNTFSRRDQDTVFNTVKAQCSTSAKYFKAGFCLKILFFFCLLCPSWVVTGLPYSLKMKGLNKEQEGGK